MRLVGREVLRVPGPRRNPALHRTPQGGGTPAPGYFRPPLRGFFGSVRFPIAVRPGAGGDLAAQRVRRAVRLAPQVLLATWASARPVERAGPHHAAVWPARPASLPGPSRRLQSWCLLAPGHRTIGRTGLTRQRSRRPRSLQGGAPACPVADPLPDTITTRSNHDHQGRVMLTAVPSRATSAALSLPASVRWAATIFPGGSQQHFPVGRTRAWDLMPAAVRG
jgi:hypothetical protein